MFEKQTDSGVSPVIGVILMVAVTVALVALVTVVVFDIGGDVSESPDATVQLEQTGSGEIEATVLSNENVDSFYINDSTGGSTQLTGSDAEAGGSTTVTGLSSSDTVQVIAVMPDGSQEVLTSTEVN